MARASYRRRSDGLIEIVRPGIWQRFGGTMTMKKAAAALLVVLAGTAGFGLYSVFGVPFLVLLCSLGLAGALWQGAKPRRTPATIRSVRARRTVAP